MKNRNPQRLLTTLLLTTLPLALLLLGCPATDGGAPQGYGGDLAPEAAAAFMDQAESELLTAWIAAETADWAQATDINDENQAASVEANRQRIELAVKKATEATRFDSLELDADVARKMQLLKLDLNLPAPSNAEETAELAGLAADMKAAYGKGRYCPDGEDSCQQLGDFENVIDDPDRDPEERKAAWVGWRTIAPPMRDQYTRYAELANKGARELGFADFGAMWRSKYDMTAEEFGQDVDRLWGQVRPFYEALHCHVRAELNEKYGDDVVDPSGPIPAHLLGNMWSQTWANVYPQVKPDGGSEAGYDLTEIIKEKGIDEKEMVRYGERFFTSLGFDPLPDTFWERSQFVKPEDRDVVCHASAWDVDLDNDLRIKMCIEKNAEDFITIHHELGHNFYQRAYNRLPPLYRQSAHEGFHEAVGDTIALSITPSYLVQVGLLDAEPPTDADLAQLLRLALDKVAFLPFGLLVDQWRWKVFAGEVMPENYNQAWWELRRKYQGIAPPVERSEADFDPGAKYHVPANVSYTRYFLAHILQFQFHRGLCEAAGYEGPLHRCSIYGSEVAGEKLEAMLAMGISRPWPDALEAMSGERQMDASAIAEYFAPVKEWLDKENEGRTCGW